MSQTFDFQKIRVRFQDVDHAGILFFARIYDYCHTAYEEFMEEVGGQKLQEFFSPRGIGSPLVATHCEHAHPLRHGDRVRIALQVAQMGRSSLTLRYTVYNQEDRLCATVFTRHVFVSESFKSTPIPQGIRDAFEAFRADGISLPFSSPTSRSSS